MMGLSKLQLPAKFEVAGFMYHTPKICFKNWEKPKWGNPLFLEKLTFALNSRPQCFLLYIDTTFVTLWLQKIGEIYEKLFSNKKN